MATTSHITDHLFKIEDNRLASVVDKNNLSYYAYDHSGGSCGSRVQSQACLSYAEMEQRRQCQRVLKLTWCKSRWLAQRRLERFNAYKANYQSIVDRVTLYTSPYLVANSSGYTKHYYAGSERICARLGNGNLSYHQTQSQPFIGNDSLLDINSKMLFNSVLASMSDRGLADNSQLSIRTLCNNNSDPLSVDLEPAPIEVAVATSFTTAGFSDIMEYFAIQTQQNESPYFYHGDHLGSASWITDASGIPVQHLQYLPFGEPFVNQHTSGYKERFTFTGKERDEETGYSYFGARYYDSDLSGLFLSVDPMADKYPSISPYAYCTWNPLKLVDPNGDTIQNAYEPYRDISEEVKYYQNKINNSTNPEEIREYSNQLSAVREKNKKYSKVEDLINSFEKTNSDEYNYLNSLSFNGKPVNVYIGLSDLSSDPETGASGQTIIPYETKDGKIMGIGSSGIKITIFRNGFEDTQNGVGTLANEFGDVLFGLVRPKFNYATVSSKEYNERPTTKYSFDYEYFIIKHTRKTRPNPFNYN